MLDTPPGVHPSTVVNDSDHGALINVAAGLCLTCSLLFFAVRLIVHWPWHSLFRLDDLAITVATLFSTLQVIVTCVAVDRGLGQRLDALSDSQLSSIKKLVFASNLLFIVTVSLARLAVALLLVRMSTTVRHAKISKMIAVATIVVMVVCLLVVGVDSRPARYEPESANRIMPRWIVAGALGIALEICLILFPIHLVSGLQARLPTKLTVLAGFGLRLPVVAFGILRLVYLDRSLHQKDYTFAFPTAEIFTQVDAAYGLVSATLPCLRIFLHTLYTGRLAGDVSALTESQSAAKSSRYGPRSGGGSRPSRMRVSRAFSRSAFSLSALSVGASGSFATQSTKEPHEPVGDEVVELATRDYAPTRTTTDPLPPHMADPSDPDHNAIRSHQSTHARYD